MKKCIKAISIALAAAMTASVMSVETQASTMNVSVLAASANDTAWTSADEIKLSKNTVSLETGKTIAITVSGITDVKVTTSSSMIASASYSAKTNKITIKGSGFGTATIKVYSKADNKVCKSIKVSVKAPKISGEMIEKDDYTFFKKADGTYATGWNEIDGKQYYFYPNGVMNHYDIMYNNKMYYVDKNGAYTGKVGKYYLFNCNGEASAITSNAKTFYDENKSGKYSDYVNKYWGVSIPTEIDIVAPCYVPGAYNYCLAYHRFTDEDSTLENFSTSKVGDDVDLSKYTFDNSVEIYGKTSELSQTTASFVNEKYLVPALNEAFGKKAAKAETDFGKGYRWTNVGAEKVTVDVSFTENAFDMLIYKPVS